MKYITTLLLSLVCTLSAQTIVLSPHQPRSGELTTMATNGSAYYLNRANHTGFQLLATISDAGTLAALNAVASAQITDGTIVDGDIADGTITAAKLAAGALSYGGFGFADAGKIPQFPADGSLMSSSMLVYSSGRAYPATFMYPTSFAFVQTGGKTLYLQAASLDTDHTITIPSTTGTMALLSNITLAQLPQTGATSGQAIAWNGSAWVPTTISSGLTMGTTSANGVAGNVLYTDGTKVQQYTVVPSTEGGTGVANNGSFTNASNTTITGGGTIALAGFTLTVPSTGTVALRGITNAFTANSTVSTPAMSLSGQPFTGGTATTTKPYFLLEPTGATSSGWPTSGSILGINTPVSFGGVWAEMQLNGTRYVAFSPALISLRASEIRLTNSTPLYFGPSSTVDVGILRTSSTSLAVSATGGPTELRLIGDNAGSGSSEYLSIGHNGTDGTLSSGAAGGSIVVTSQTAIFQLGVDVNGDAVDQIVKAADGITGTDRDGGDLNLSSGNSTGQGESAIVFKAPLASSSGTTTRTAAERARIDGKGLRVGNLIIWSDAANAPAEDPPTGCYYLYVDPATGALNTRSYNGNVQTITPP